MARPSRPQSRDPLETAVAYHRAGRLDQAEAQYNRVLQRAPNHPDALNLLGVIAHERGRPTRAIQIIRQALAVKPRFPEALANLARAQRDVGDMDGALASARQAVALNPRLPEAQVQLGRSLLEQEQWAEAAAACRDAAALAPQLLDAHVNLGAALTKLRDWRGAVAAYRIAHRLAPGRAETLTDLATALTELHHYDEALRCHERAIALDPKDARAAIAFATALKQSQDIEGAVRLCHRALELVPDRADVWVMLGGNMASLGRFAEADAAYRTALEIDPNSGDARRGLVTAGRLASDESEIARLQQLVADTAQPDPQRAAAGFALGRLYDRANEFDLAFAQYEGANRLLHARQIAEGKGFDPAAVHKQVDELIAAWSPDYFTSALPGNPSELPVFIVGMPRSGTTLTEQILASHPQVFGAGERQDIGRIAATLAGPMGRNGPSLWPVEAVRQLAAAHVERLRGLGGEATRVIDKMPDNIFWVGSIATLFPNARVIFCRRDLRDVGLSCFFQQFTAGLTWANDLTDIAIRAREVERLTAHWLRVLPLRVLEVQYEALVADLETQSRRLIDFLGLPWDPACLEFHRTERQVTTASLWQVRQPLYDSSVGRWRHYRTYLGPLLQGLAGLVADAPDAAPPSGESAPTGST